MIRVKEEILKSIESTLHSIVPGARIVLFGSRARGDENAGSDWDILVILDKSIVKPLDYDRVVYPLYELGWELGEHFSVKVYSKSEWERRSFTPFYKKVEKEGILL